MSSSFRIRANRPVDIKPTEVFRADGKLVPEDGWVEAEPKAIRGIPWVVIPARAAGRRVKHLQELWEMDAVNMQRRTDTGEWEDVDEKDWDALCGVSA